MDVFKDFMMSYGWSLIAAAITAVAGFIGKKWSEYNKTKEDNKFIQYIIPKVVQGVEQKYKDLKGSEKFYKAFENVSEILEHKGIYLSEIEIEMAIESAVLEFNKYWKDDV